MKTAFVVGASGSVGKSLIQELINSRGFSKIVTFGRSKQGVTQVSEVLINMTPKELEAAVLQEIANTDQEIVGFSVLGVGAGTAKLSIEEHRAIDVELNHAFARALKRSGKVRHLNFMSAAGANPNASTKGSGAAGMARYNRVKGESEEAVKSVGLDIVSIYRPAMIIGSVHTPWLLAKALPMFAVITPKKYLSISTTQIAKSMIAAGINTPSKSDLYHYPEMIKLIDEANVKQY